MNKEEYTSLKLEIPRLSDFQIKESINNGLNLIEELNKLAIEDTQEKYIRELLNRIDKAIKYIKENEKEYGSLEDNEKIILEILKGKE